MTQDTVRMQEMSSNLKKNILTSLESSRRFPMLNSDTTDRDPKLLIKLANTTDSLHLG